MRASMKSPHINEAHWWYIIPIITITFFAAVVVLDFLPLPEPSEELRQRMIVTLSGNPWVNVLLLCVLTPLIEEWLCRGFVLRQLLKLVNPWVAVPVSAVFFGALHGNLWQAVPATLLGVYLGWIYFKFRRLWICIFLHAVNNGMTLALFVLMGEKSLDMTFSALAGGGAGSYMLLACALLVLAGGAYTIQKFIPFNNKVQNGESDLSL